MKPAIRITNLAKRYRLGELDRHHWTLGDRLAALFRRERANGAADGGADEIWALNDVSFDVAPGEVVGIVGRNGAGKSTLLKILSRITEPTRGAVELRGRVSSLLEVGTGFHPELTGRENVYLNGSILGMRKAEIDRKFAAIVDFAGVERFLDTPVKRYSSGMQVRLAFAVAAHLEPEILIVDEVLAVGDAEFQRKCLGKMGDVAQGGRTVIFVSHNMGAVRQLCRRVLVIDEGRVRFDGDAEAGVARYLSGDDPSAALAAHWVWPEEDRPRGGGIEVVSVRLVGERSPGPFFAPDEAIEAIVEYRQSEHLSQLRFGLWLVTLAGEIAFVTTDHAARDARGYPPGRYRTRCTIPAHLLNCIPYVIRISASVPLRQILIPQTYVGRIEIAGPGNQGSPDAKWAGVVCPKIDWRIDRVASSELAGRAGSSHAAAQTVVQASCNPRII